MGAVGNFQFTFRQKRIGSVVNTMDEFTKYGVEVSDTARNAATWTGTNNAIATIISGLGFGATTTGGAFQVGKLYEIVTVGTTDYTLVGASANTVGVVFRATGAGAGTGTVRAAGEHTDVEGHGRILLSGAPVYVGTGNGTLTAISFNYNAEVAEVWTITATSATNFTVTGSVSGAQAAATVGTLYDNGIISFLITAGGTAFVAGGVWTLTVTKALVLDGVYVDGKKTTASLSALTTALATPLTTLGLLP